MNVFKNSKWLKIITSIAKFYFIFVIDCDRPERHVSLYCIDTDKCLFAIFVNNFIMFLFIIIFLFKFFLKKNKLDVIIKIRWS